MTKARLEPRRGQKRAGTQLFSDLEEEVMLTVPVVSGSAPIQEARARMFLSTLL